MNRTYPPPRHGDRVRFVATGGDHLGDLEGIWQHDDSHDSVLLDDGRQVFQPSQVDIITMTTDEETVMDRRQRLAERFWVVDDIDGHAGELADADDDDREYYYSLASTALAVYAGDHALLLDAYEHSRVRVRELELENAAMRATSAGQCSRYRHLERLTERQRIINRQDQELAILRAQKVAAERDRDQAHEALGHLWGDVARRSRSDITFVVAQDEVSADDLVTPIPAPSDAPWRGIGRDPVTVDWPSEVSPRVRETTSDDLPTVLDQDGA